MLTDSVANQARMNYNSLESNNLSGSTLAIYVVDNKQASRKTKSGAKPLLCRDMQKDLLEVITNSHHDGFGKWYDNHHHQFNGCHMNPLAKAQGIRRDKKKHGINKPGAAFENRRSRYLKNAVLR
jgi:hypothetical protein